jgi:glycerophosphoryl diester phosphodiesterase
MRRTGKRVVTWTVDNPDRARQLADPMRGRVDAIITNDPRAIRAAISVAATGS